MFKHIVLIGCAAFTLQGCAQNAAFGSLQASPAAQAKINKILSYACPINEAALPIIKTLKGLEYDDAIAAHDTLAIACPPNAPPTDILTISLDIVAAETTLAPIFAQVKK
jgi:hypothetical protein